MNALVIYDSVFGNTERIARAIGAALEAGAAVETLPVGQASAEELRGPDLLIVGSPTRGFRPTEATAKLLAGRPARHLAGVLVAAFDTRINLTTIDSSVLRFVVDKGGYAARTIAKALEKAGGRLLCAPEGFLVTGEQGPLKDGELERAAVWAEALGRLASQ